VGDTDGPEAFDIESLAAQMLGLEEQSDEEFEEEEEPQAGHPAWQQILAKIPPELHAEIIPTLQEWDSGVSRRFQKIHDEYAPYKRFEEVDPDEIKEALEVYQALNSDPASTWEAIGRVYGLSPQQVSQVADASESDDFDLGDLPPAIRDRLSRLDVHDKVLEAITGELLQRQEAEKESDEDAQLEEYLDQLRQQYGDYDEDYVVGLIASGIDGDEAVARFQSFTQQFAQHQSRQTPRIMSGGGGIPNNESVNVSRLSNQDTQKLVEELLRLSQDS
jgi:hypothetical protein